MKIDLSCASQASTAICSTTDHQSMIRLGTRPIHPHNPPHYSRSLPSSSHQQLLQSPNSKSKSSTHRKSTSSRKSSVKKTELISPPGSTRYLLNHHHKPNFFNVLSDFDPVSALVPFEPPTKPKPVAAGLNSSTSSTRSPVQVVVLRVSLHCKGCEGKVRKHISRMEGVTSFSIDFPSKKVTVIGDVTPLGVLSSVSKVKNAQFWPASSMAPTSLAIGRSY